MLNVIPKQARVILVVTLCLIWAGRLLAGPPVATTEPLSPAEEAKKFKLPPGFEIQLVASEPDIQKPMNLAFDAQGRLWVTHSIEYPFAATDPAAARDGVTILDGIGADGKATRITRFADKLNIPIGVLPMPNGREVIVWSIPNIWKLTDTDGDGKADQQEILYGPFDFADTHGNQNSFRLGLDGWIYACHGFRNSSKIKLRGEGPVVLEMNSGNTYRFRPDGSAIEQITWGQVNPFGMCFDNRGDFFTADCHSKPITLLLRGGYYDSFGKPHDGLGFAPLATSDDHGSTGIAGIVSYSSSHFPREYQGAMFVGNVVTNIVHVDYPQWRGSSPWIEKPQDFLTSEDWWFHPVDLQLGPDGALYICDFYNSIIGHYEVDLQHPLRDRHRGRIWRVVYTGHQAGGKKLTPPAVPNFVSMSEDDLVKRLSDDNLVNRVFAAQQLEQRFPQSGISKARERLKRTPPSDERQSASLADERVQTLWLLSRSGKLDEAMIDRFARDEAAVVRIHLAKGLAEKENWNHHEGQIVRTLLGDSDPFVRRAAAEALGRHPQAENFQPLVHLWRSTPSKDVQLIHAARIALRNQLRPTEAVDQLTEQKLTREELASVAEIALAVPSEAAAWFTFDYVQKHELPQPVVERSLAHVARYVSTKRLDEVAAYIQQKFPGDIPRQAALFQSLFSGVTQRGAKLSRDTALGKWGESLAMKLLSPDRPRSAPWENFPLASAATASPWGVRQRGSTDGNVDAYFFDSIANGETLTGILRSAPFAIPERLTFWMCGHNGFPGSASKGVNQVRLKLVESGETIAREVPPRNDVAHEHSWDLKQWSGQQGVLEIVDADSGTAYAWVAAGRFSPPVVASPVPNFSFADVTLVTAVQVANQLQLDKLAKPILALLADAHVDVPVRMAAAQAGLNLSRESAVTALSELVQSSAEPAGLRTYAAQLLGSVNTAATREALGVALRSAPAPLQQPIALSLAGTSEGAESLFTLISTGRASARLLQDKPVLDRLTSLAIPDLDAKIEELTEGLPDPDDRLKQLIAQFAASFDNADATPDAGRAVFKKSCFACHRISDEGGKVGPQLDGVGHRGLERLLEDVLDPNRNVDAAFRASVVVKNDGLVVTGLKLREEGNTLVLGDNQGKEVRIPTEEIDEVRLSNLSPMPSNFAEQLNEADLRALVTYLLSQKQAVKKE
ncbi:PVC-type heme-binding CxxCH protein [Schlesneria sp. DSM 10557]|uniref:PVC-type heme-binding CxxCH protein n=1 Tax=Schlesneria sp. DSM 10557 TaxID=3044399 RepID=UPI0035A1855A